MNMEAGEQVGYEPGRSNKTRQAEIKAALGTITEHHLIDDRGLEFLGEGGQRVAFTLDQFPGHVAKIGREQLMRNMNDEAGAHSQEERWAVRATMHLALAEELARERISEQELRQYFGDMVLRERLGLMNIPVNQALIDAVGTTSGPLPWATSGISEVETIVSLQDKAPLAAFGPESRGLKTYYLEEEITNESVYTHLNSCFLDCTEYAEPEDMLVLMDQSDVGLQTLLAEAERDESLHQLLSNFVAKAIKYSRETGKILDFVGSNNVRVYHDEVTQDWRVIMLDVRVGGTILLNGQSVLASVLARQPVSTDGMLNLVNALSYTRLVNALAAELGVPDRLAMSTNSIAPQSKMLLRRVKVFYQDYRKSQEQFERLETAAK